MLRGIVCFVLVAACMAVGARAQGTLVAPPREGVAELELRGDPGNQVRIEAAAELRLPEWETIGAVLLTNTVTRFSDPWCGTAPSRFYRITRSEGSLLPFAENFQLLDQEGRARELHYFWNDNTVDAFVLIFTSNGCADVESRLEELEALAEVYASEGVVFWMINSKTGDTRQAIRAEAARLGIDWPVLHDAAQNVARAYGVRGSPEVVCVERETFSIFYQGAIDDLASGEGTPTRNYLAEALESFKAGENVVLRQTKAGGCDVELALNRPISYSQEIAPILQNKCVTCHSPGNIAPWAMTNYNIVRTYSSAIKYQVMSGQMPPWHADPEYGSFRNDFSLTTEEQAKLIAWIEQGAPQDGTADPLENVPPPPPKWPLELGEPDLVIKPPVQTINATGVEPYRYVFVDTGLTSNVWLKAALIRPSNPRVVHHYLVWEGRTTMQMATGIAGYVPGGPALPFPEGTGLQLLSGSSLTFNLHYTPYGEEAEDEPELALWFHDQPPPKTLLTLPLLDQNFVIPPGAREYEVTFQQITPLPATLYRMAPHMHYRGKSMKFEVVYPNNTREVLLSVPDYHFDWQMTYQLETPKQIPAGTRLIITGTFDNSEQNPHNPDPGQTVTWGDQSWEEMFIGYFDFSL